MDERYILGFIKRGMNAPMFVSKVFGFFFYDIIFAFGRRGTRAFRNCVLMSFMRLGSTYACRHHVGLTAFLSSTQLNHFTDMGKERAENKGISKQPMLPCVCLQAIPTCDAKDLCFNLCGPLYAWWLSLLLGLGLSCPILLRAVLMFRHWTMQNVCCRSSPTKPPSSSS